MDPDVSWTVDQNPQMVNIVNLNGLGLYLRE